MVSLIFWPLATLLWLQMAILPYHSPDLLLWQRVALSIDVLLLAWLWPKTLDSHDSSRDWWKRGFGLFIGWGRVWQARRDGAALKKALTQRWPEFRAFIHMALLGVVLLPVVLLSWLVACLPDSPEDRWLAGFPEPISITVDVDNDGKSTRRAFALTASLHEQHARQDLSEDDFNSLQAQGAKPCPGSEQADKSMLDKAKPDSSPTSQSNAKKEPNRCLMVQPWLPRNLILREKVLTADPLLKPELEVKFQASAESPKQDDFDQIRGLDLQNRNFDYADFSRSSLPKVDLRYASLKQAALIGSRLDRALMQYTHLENANLERGKSIGADFSSASLIGTNLSYADLTDAILVLTKLTGLDSRFVTLNGVDLSFSNLVGATLDETKLVGANLESANLTGMDFNGFSVKGAVVRASVDLTGANLNNAKLNGTHLSHAILLGADLRIDRKPLTENEIIVLAEELRGALSHTAEYRGSDNLYELEERIEEFKRRASHPADFSRILKPIQPPCLRNSEDKDLLPHCMVAEALTDKDRQLFIDIFLRLTCESSAVASRMIERTLNYHWDYGWLSKPLLDASQSNIKCTGIAGLSEEIKAQLKKLVTPDTGNLEKPVTFMVRQAHHKRN